MFPLLEGAADFKYYHSKNGFRYLIGLHGIKPPFNSERCLFPTLLKSKFHRFRSTIGSYSKMGTVEVPCQGPVVDGIEINWSTDKTHLFQVTDRKGQLSTYKILLFR